jgi:hypothetical protein
MGWMAEEFGFDSLQKQEVLRVSAGLKRLGREADSSPPSIAEVELYLNLQALFPN